MPVAVSYPGVYIEEIPSGVRTIAGVATSIGLFIGWAPKGATDNAVRITNFSDYEREYGGLDTRSFLGYAVRQFFENGGADAYVIRLSAEESERASIEINDNLRIIASSPGAWANTVGVRIARRTDNEQRFRLDVVNADNAILESFANLSMTVTDPRFPENVINERSRLITVEGSNADEAPTDTESPTFLSGGVDGPVLDPGTNAFHTALEKNLGEGTVTDRIDLFNIVCVPGETNPGMLSKLQNLCLENRAFLLVDSPVDATVANMRENGLEGLTESNAIHSAVFYPWVRQTDPLMAGAIRSFPPCGFVAGVFARTDASRGVWKAPAGIDATINGAAGLLVNLSDQENGQLNLLGINCLRILPVYGKVVWGSRTLHGQNDRGSEWKYIPVRRVASFIEESLFRGTQWVVFEPNDEPLWAQIRLNIGAFMHSLFRQGAFQGTTPRQAYFVKCDSETTTQNDINLGIVNIIVGFAPLKPAEFVIIKIQQMTGDLEV